jgi:spore maturation protein CgeB
MHILYVGPASGTSLHRLDALRRLGHAADLLDPRHPALGGALTSRWVVHTGAFGVSRLTAGWIRRCLGMRRYDLAIVDGGDLLGPEHVDQLKASCRRVINYNPDNPYVGCDGQKWRIFLASVPRYDLIVTPRQSSVAPAYAQGARDVLLVSFAADEVVHRPPEPAAAKTLDVVFVGTWMKERGPFFRSLLSEGLPVTIFGPSWHKARERALLRPNLREGYLDDGRYVAAIASAKIALALLSAENEDLHTTRSMEIPAIGTLLCGERTAEHLALYREGEEAVFWSSPAECAARCRELLASPADLDRIARAGRARALRNGRFNERILARMIDAAISPGAPARSAP